ncbi:hypothetical protein [Hydrogenophaga pseudoflava]|uniref:hypothetical protein n=1 Tax=Hydrogenophaga pseudoflava TaxID=47421 RepID=UPI0027E4DB92|nr:hypothetical protein [Hydrogenophaga pseudoflava]MDQ7746299.1 hypothetical protein [Hydrogenophaga pseudoflava]
MASDEQVLLMSNQLQAFELKSLVLKPTARPATTVVAETPVPVSPDGSLQPQVLYEASDDANARYQLPRYEWNMVGGRHTSRLRLRTADDDPHGPLGWLNIELLAVHAVDARFAMRTIPHTATLRLGYEMPVVSSGEPEAPPWEGQWENTDPATRGMTRLVIGRRADGGWSMHGFGKCHPSDCDWGETTAMLSGDALIGVYAFGFKVTTLTARRSGQTLVVDVLDDYTDADGRTDRLSQYVMARSVAAAPAQPLIWEALGPLNPLGGSVHRCTLPFHAQEDYDRIHQIITSPVHRARLEVVCKATVGQRTWQQWWLHDRPAVAPVRPDIDVVRISPAVLNTLRTRPVAAAVPRMPAIASLRAERASVATLALARGVRRPHHEPDLDEALSREEAARVLRTLPRRVAIDKKGRPVLVRREAECTQSLACTFDPQADGYMLDAPRDPSQAHVLFKHDLVADGQSVTFFQDSLVRDQVYFEPQEFRLARSDASPFLPSLVFAITDVATESEALSYRVRLAFQARPHLGQAFVLLARQHFGPAARLTALTPRSARLTLGVPTADGAPPALLERPDAVIRFDEGITDELSLDEAQFVRLAAAFQSPAGIGMQGWVTATISDGTQVDIPLVVSLKDNTGSVFDPQLLRPDPDGVPGHCVVTLRNRIESPVRVNGVHAQELGVWTDPATGVPQTVTVRPLDLPPAAPVLPGQTVDLRFAVTPAAFPLLSITPALDLDIQPDLARLMGQLTVTEAFTEATFEVQVSASPLFFGPGALTALRVEFDDGPVVALDAGTLVQTVSLRKPVVARILGLEPGYRYRLVAVDAQRGERVHEGLAGVGHLQVSLPQG